MRDLNQAPAFLYALWVDRDPIAKSGGTHSRADDAKTERDSIIVPVTELYPPHMETADGAMAAVASHPVIHAGMIGDRIPWAI